MEPILNPHQPGQTFHPGPNPAPAPTAGPAPQPVTPQHQPLLSPVPEPVSLPPDSVSPLRLPTEPQLPPHHETELPVLNITNSQKAKKRSVAKILLGAASIVLLLTSASFAYLWVRANNNYQSSQNLLLQLKAERDKQNQVPDFVNQYNGEDLSTRLCNGGSLGMFDVHINKDYAVFKYLCAAQATPVRIGVFEKNKNGTYAFLNTSSLTSPNDLPSFVYDTDADFFAEYGAKRIEL